MYVPPCVILLVTLDCTINVSPLMDLNGIMCFLCFANPNLISRFPHTMYEQTKREARICNGRKLKICL